METSKTFDELVKEAQEVITLFQEHDPKPWPLEAKALDMTAQMGIIHQALLENRGYKQKGQDSDRLATALATLFFISLDIAQDLDINLAAKFGQFLKETKKSLK